MGRNLPGPLQATGKDIHVVGKTHGSRPELEKAGVRIAASYILIPLSGLFFIRVRRAVPKMPPSYAGPHLRGGARRWP